MKWRNYKEEKPNIEKEILAYCSLTITTISPTIYVYVFLHYIIGDGWYDEPELPTDCAPVFHDIIQWVYKEDLDEDRKNNND